MEESRAVVRTEIINFLLEQQNKDGSWGFSPGKAGVIEPTAYALMSLASEDRGREAVERGLVFLRRTQTARGAWAVSTQDSEEAPWATALAGLALINFRGNQEVCLSAAEFILDSFGRMPRHWVLQAADWMRSLDASYVEENLRGWKWSPDTANWVEPTAYAVLYLKSFMQSSAGTHVAGVLARARNALRNTRMREVLTEAESLLSRRMCKEGGWNYGNSSVLGIDLRPYPLTTALVLIALQGPCSNQECHKSLMYLREVVLAERSALALCLVALCFDLYRLKTEPLIQTLADLYEETQFFQNIKTSALALLVMQSVKGQNVFLLRNS